MNQRLPLVLSAAALLVALLGSTPLGEAARGVVPFAKKAGYAKNAGAVQGIKASRRVRPGRLLPLGANGRFPRRVTAPALHGLELVTASSELDATDAKTVLALCPEGKRTVGGGARADDPSSKSVALQWSHPNQAGGEGWLVQAVEITPLALEWQVTAYVLCATGAS